MDKPIREGMNAQFREDLIADLRARASCVDDVSGDLMLEAARILRKVSFTAAQPQLEGGGEVWRCFHCDEVFTDQESAAEHFGTKIRHDPACTIDPAEFRRLQDKETDYAEQDAAIHRSMARMETEHRLALEREEIKGYERGLRDSGKRPFAAPPSAPVEDAVAYLDNWLRSAHGLDIGHVAVGEALERALAQQPARQEPIA